MTTTDPQPVKLPPRQAEVLAFIRANAHVYGPTVREIAAAMGIKSPNGVFGHLKALEKKGHIKRRPGIARGLVAVEADHG